MKDIRMMLRVASLYYNDGLTHQEIAQRFQMSRQTVGRLLRAARESGLVEVRIHQPRHLFVNLEQQLEQKFGLKEAIVVPNEGGNNDALMNALGDAAAQYLYQHVKSNDTLGISWGLTLASVARQLEESRTHGVRVVQLNGGLARGQTITNASELVRRFGDAFNADTYGLNVPAIVDSIEICQAIYSDSKTRETLDLARAANFCLFSIGALTHMSVLVEAGYISSTDVQLLREKGVVGDICSRYIDVRGEIADAELNARTIGIELADLREKETVVAVAGGSPKLDAIRGALAGKYCNVLITDEIVASDLLSGGGHK